MTVFNQARPDFEPYGFTCVRWTPTRMPRPDRHNEVELNLLQSGSLTYLLGGQRITIRAGRFVAFWAAIPHQILKARDNPEYFVVTLPLTWFLQCRLPETFVHRVLHGQVVCDPKARPETCDFQACERWAADRQSGGPERQRAARIETEARLPRLALSGPDDTSPSTEPRQRSESFRTAWERVSKVARSGNRACPGRRFPAICRKSRVLTRQGNGFSNPLFRDHCGPGRFMFHWPADEQDRVVACRTRGPGGGHGPGFGRAVSGGPRVV